jgi:hypothetical protein
MYKEIFLWGRDFFVPIYHIYGSNITHERDFGVDEMSVPLHQISERDQDNEKLHIK